MACGSARGLVASCSHVCTCVCWYPFTVCRGEYFLTFYFFLLLYLGISSRPGVGRQRVRRRCVMTAYAMARCGWRRRKRCQP